MDRHPNGSTTFNATVFSSPLTGSFLQSQKRIWQSAFLFTFFVFTFFGNVATLFRLWGGRSRSSAKKLSNISMLYLQLAVADLLAAFCCVLSNAIMYLMEHFVAGNLVCKVFKFLQKLGLASSTFIVVAISLDRCLAVLHPMQRVHIRRTAKGMVIIAWLGAVLMSLPQIFIFNVNLNHAVEPTVLQCDDSTGYTEPWQEVVYSLTNLVVLYVVPFICISASYGLIVHTVSREIKFPEDGESIRMESFLHKGEPLAPSTRTMRFIHAKKTSLALSFVVVTTFVLCWAPFYVTLMLHILRKPEPHEDLFYNHAIYFCGLGHSVMNPLLYGAFHVLLRSRKLGSCCASRTTTTDSIALQISPSASQQDKTAYQSLGQDSKKSSFHRNLNNSKLPRS